MRLLLTRRPDPRPAIASAYRLDSADGKAYIGDVGAIKLIDPAFAASLR
jgi:hypothetical protein